MRKIKCISILFLTVILMLCACGIEKQEPQQGQQEGIYNIYYVNKDATKVVGEVYEPKTQKTEAMIKEFLGQLARDPQDLQLKKSLESDIKLNDYYFDKNQLTLDFDVSYFNLDKTTEVLTRAAIVRTLTQIPEVEGVIFHVAGELLMDSSKNSIGTMTADTFIDNTGKEINSYEKTTLRLYFANKEGTGLVETNEEVVYSSNISMEKLIVEKLIEGPKTDQVRATLSPNRKIISVSVKDGICYVNLSGITIDNLGAVSEDVSVYSIVNSLSELKNVNKVQISIDGDTDRMFRESISLKKVLERNLDLVQSEGDS